MRWHLLWVPFVLLVAACLPENRDRIRIVGSSTVYPFVTVVAEQFGRKTDFKTPIVEATGTGGGFKLFCSGIGNAFPDFANASRPIKSSEKEQCAQNGITDITEIKIGYDGIVLARSKKAEVFNLTLPQIFLALAQKIPHNSTLIDNPHKRWNDISPALPDLPIVVYGPPPTSGTRDAFVELVMEHGCVDMPEFIAAYADKDARKKACHQLREDGAYVDAGENDNVIVQKLKANPDALGIFGFSFMEENGSTVQGSPIDGILPDFEHIASGEYGISRSLFVYAKTAHLQTVPGMSEFIQELRSTDALGMQGYLVAKGLIPLSDAELEAK